MENELDNIANSAQEVLNSHRNSGLGRVHAKDDTRKDAQADDATDLGTNLRADVNVVGAALLGERNAVTPAGAEAKIASECGNLGEEADVESRVNISGNRSEAKLVRVEEQGSVGGLLNVQTVKTGNDSLEISRDVGLDVNLSETEQLDLGLDLGASNKGDGADAGLAVLVRGVVLADLGRGGGAEIGELDVDRGKNFDLGGGPGTNDEFTNANIGSSVPLLARGAATRLGPGAVAHGVGAFEGSGGGFDAAIHISL